MPSPAPALADRANLPLTRPDTPHDHKWDCYAGTAAALHKGRVTGYPRLVEAGRLTQLEADRRIAVMAAIAEIWRAAWHCRLPDPAIVVLLSEGPHAIDRCAIVDELRHARQVTAARLARDPGNGAAQYQLECLDEMIDWHLRFTDGPLFCVRITLQLRANHCPGERRDDSGMPGRMTLRSAA